MSTRAIKNKPGRRAILCWRRHLAAAWKLEAPPSGCAPGVMTGCCWPDCPTNSISIRKFQLILSIQNVVQIVRDKITAS